ncbi:Unannotated [Lentimonas sp. CC19]|nr:Unannotated [Lentimonas sp. CC19]CAA6694003.1 Unannotated [Lentimonas sp. CC10]CAA7072231.1 Unannotated [Lentimonas sp. CC11]
MRISPKPLFTSPNLDVGLNIFVVEVSATGGSDMALLNITVDAAAPASWTVLNSESFESGRGDWNDYGSDCRRSSNDSAYATAASTVSDCRTIRRRHA